MGLKTEAGLVSAMSGRAIRTADDFDSQEVANLMWALAVLDEKALFVVFEDCKSFPSAQELITNSGLSQLHQACITIDLSTEPASGKAASLHSLMSVTSVARNKAFRSAPS
eukprot:3035463-Rhodomonas_salina.1